MKIAISTINFFYKKPLSTSRIVELIGLTEIEIEEILYAKVLDQKIIAVKILDVFPHPGADRLRLVDIDAGAAGKHRLVCGAPNLVVGQKVAWVQPGSTLPDGTLIEKAKIRGEASAGMLASERELGISQEHTGIIELQSPTPLGTRLCDIAAKTDTLDIKTPANRWDFLSGEGIARELAVYDSKIQFSIPNRGEYVYKKIDYVNVKVREENPRFVSAHLRLNNDVKTPSWIVDNLLANGYTPHNAVVDITNYCMLETGQPSHAYDAKTLTSPLATRFAKDNEKITTLDGVERSLSAHDLVVADSNGPVGLAGVMGSFHTQIQTGTTDVILEAAQWDKTLVRRSAVRHGLRTEASARFERSLPLPLAPYAFARMLDLLTEICAAEIVEGPFDQLYAWPWQRFLGVRMHRAEHTLGAQLSQAAMLSGLKRLGFGAEHFSLKQELSKHVSKPYKWGANYKQDGETAFDCSYLVDRIYSKLGLSVGHTALGQFHHGRPVLADEPLKPGDVVFLRGLIKQSPVDHYYRRDHTGLAHKVVLDAPEEVGHNGIYMGNNQVLQAATYEYRDGDWVQRDKTGVIVSPLAEFTNNPGYLGARRYLESFNHILALQVPWWRTDITREADIIEEFAKLLGYDNLPATLPSLPPMPGSEQSDQVDHMALRQALVAGGLTEITTYSFVSRADVEKLSIAPEAGLQVANPRSPEQAQLRTTMLASHAHFWSRQHASLQTSLVFEISRVFESRGKVEQPIERWKLAISSGNGEASLTIVQATLHNLLQQHHFDLTFIPNAKQPYLSPQRSADLQIADVSIGVIGQLSLPVQQDFGLQSALGWCELELTPLLATKLIPQLKPLPDYQLITRDISFEVNQAVWWQAINLVIKEQPQVWSVDFLSQYHSSELDHQKRRVMTCRLWLQIGPQPMAEVIDATVASIITAVQTALPDGKIQSH